MTTRVTEPPADTTAHPSWESRGEFACDGDHYKWGEILYLALEVGTEWGKPYPTTVGVNTVYYERDARLDTDVPDFPIVTLHIYGSGVDHSQMLLPTEARHIAAELIAAAAIAEGGVE